jgi:hypothetical protein
MQITAFALAKLGAVMPSLLIPILRLHTPTVISQRMIYHPNGKMKMETRTSILFFGRESNVLRVQALSAQMYVTDSGVSRSTDRRDSG